MNYNPKSWMKANEIFKLTGDQLRAKPNHNILLKEEKWAFKCPGFWRCSIGKHSSF